MGGWVWLKFPVPVPHALFPCVWPATNAGGEQDLGVGIVKQPWKTHFLVCEPGNVDMWRLLV